MPTPNGWLENLERLQKYTGTSGEDDLPVVVTATPKAEPEEPKEDISTVDEFLAAFNEVVDNMNVAAEILLKELDGIEDPQKRQDIVSGFLTGLAMKIIATIAYEQQNR